MGLLRVGRSVEGVLSAILAVFSLGAGFAVVAADNVGGWVLVVIGIAIWAGAARDAVRLARGDGEAWMGPRTLSIVAAVVVITASILVLRTPLGGAG